MQIDYNPDLALTHEHTAAEVQNFTGSFCGFVLLKRGYNIQTLSERLRHQYGIEMWPSHTGDVLIQDFMLDVPGAMVTISLIDLPIPDAEAEAAAVHAAWQGAAAAAKQHAAHLMIAVLPDTMPAFDAGKLYCSMISAAVDDEAVLAVYTSGTIMDPLQFRQPAEEAAALLDKLIFVGTYVREGGTCGYTVGMDAFGKDELEILDCAGSVETVARVLRMCAYKLIEENKAAGWYTAIEVDGAVWEGRRKDGVMVEGHSLQLKIAPAE
ncbi:MAG: hypothetical protein IJO07_03360 [Peptococcaceae bacterium]|nr:hypothetical protein [Peptococcaceae bacterium]